MRRSISKPAAVNMTPMIDVVFQMIIFFVCTAQIEQEAISASIALAEAPHAAGMEQGLDPRTITVELDKRGKIRIGGTPLSEEKLRQVLEKTVADYGALGGGIPVHIRADGMTKHGVIRQVMNLCAAAGLEQLSFVVVKDEA
jgi:biopolymer transport protein ExbD